MLIIIVVAGAEGGGEIRVSIQRAAPVKKAEGEMGTLLVLVKREVGGQLCIQGWERKVRLERSYWKRISDCPV